MTDITELALRLKLEAHRAVSNFNPQMNIKTRDLKELVEALEKAQQRIASQREYYEGVIADGGKRIAELESSTVSCQTNYRGETLLDVASRTDLVYSDGTGILEYTNINGCFVKVTAPPDKVIRFRCSNKRIYMRLVDRVKTHENAGIIIYFHKNNKDFIQ